MGWLLLIVAILSLIFPPLALVVLALLIMGVFAKGIEIAADPEDGFSPPRRKIRHRRPAEPSPNNPVAGGSVIDVHWYPVQPTEHLPSSTSDQNSARTTPAGS
jgi:hypothetical protein